MKRVSAIAVIAFGLSLALQSASARTRLPDKPPGNRLIQDFAGVIDDGAERQMESINQDLKNKAEVVIVVVTIPELVDETIEEFALRVGETWGVGAKDTDRGIVVAMSLSPRKLTIQTGYGVEGFLPDGRVGQLRDEYALPYLRKNQFTTGLFELDKALVAWSAKEFNVQITGAPLPSTSRVSRRRSRGSTVTRMILGMLAVIGFIYMGIRHPRALFWILLMLSSGGRGGGHGGGGFGGGGGFSGFGGGGFGGGGASGDF